MDYKLYDIYASEMFTTIRILASRRLTSCNGDWKCAVTNGWLL